MFCVITEEKKSKKRSKKATHPGARNGEADTLDVRLAEDVTLGDFHSFDVERPLGKEALANHQASERKQKSQHQRRKEDEDNNNNNNNNKPTCWSQTWSGSE